VLIAGMLVVNAGMYMSVTQPQTRSLRPYDDGTGEPMLIVCGNDHPAGEFPQEGAESCYTDLVAWTSIHFPVKVQGSS
jgi:hypothetical protein